MKISRTGPIGVIADGTAANYGIGVFVPAMLVGIFISLIWPSPNHLYIGALAFLAAALAIAVLRPPRTAEFDIERREVRLTIGWPPLLGRRKIIPFDDIREAKVSQFLPLGNDLGSAKPALILRRGKTIFLSTYNRSPKRCRAIVEQANQFLLMPPGKA
jgi:hypothetical protein